MKNIAMLLVSLLAGLIIGAKAQTVDVKFNANETYRTFTVIPDGDTVINGTTKSKVFFVNKTYKYTYLLESYAERVSTTGRVTFTIAGSSDGVKYKTLQTVTWYCTTADTSVIFDSNTTYYAYRYLRSSITGATAGTRAKLGPQYLTVGK